MKNDLTWRMRDLNEIAWDMKYGEDGVMARLSRLEDQVAVHDAQMKMFAWESYRKDDESLEDAKKRFFRTLPEATGGLRMLQLASVQLLHEFDELCRELGLRYWIAFGTLLGAQRNAGFIPWDDDMDLGMMRGDILKLVEAVKESDRYRVTVVYDWFAQCRQVRFCYADGKNPCFLDLFIYDYAKSSGHEAFAAMKADRACMIDSIKEDSNLGFWCADSAYLDAHAEGAQGVAWYFDQVVEAEYATEGRLTFEESEAQAIVWGVDNMEDNYTRDWCYPITDVFPCQRIAFEGAECNAPGNIDRFLTEAYGDIYELPADMLSHYKHVDPAVLDKE